MRPPGSPGGRSPFRRDHPGACSGVGVRGYIAETGVARATSVTQFRCRVAAQHRTLSSGAADCRNCNAIGSRQSQIVSKLLDTQA